MVFFVSLVWNIPSTGLLEDFCRRGLTVLAEHFLRRHTRGRGAKLRGAMLDGE